MTLHVALLHEHMLDKQQMEVTTSLTLIDLHDICRSARTYGAGHFFISHPAESMRKLANILAEHWKDGYGSTYNPDRKNALGILHINTSFDETLSTLESTHGKKPVCIATSAKDGDGRISFPDMRSKIEEDTETPYLLMLGTGWGMSDELLAKADYFLSPVRGPGDYNHLSVRSACAIMLDRLCGK